jgi:hypothetical protein
VALHDLDIPWRPSDLNQRGGRFGRKGNWLAKAHFDNQVPRFIYATEKSLDNYKFNLLQTKQRFIDQIKNSQISVRSIDEGAFDEQSGMGFAEYIAILSGDTSLLDKTRIDKKVAVLEGSRSSHYKEVSRARVRLDAVQQERSKTVLTLEKLAMDEETYKGLLTHDEEGTKHNPIRISGLESADPEVIGKHIIDLYRNWKPAKGESEDKQIGSLYGFDLYIRQQREGLETNGLMEYKYSNSLYAEGPQSGIKYLYNGGLPNIDNPKLAARYFISAIDRVVSLKEKYEKEVTTLDKEVPVLKGIMKREFDKEQELADLKAEAAVLQEKIAGTIRENQMRIVEETESEDVAEDQDEDKILSLNTDQENEPRRAIGR